ncbi:carbon storage regulator CsrA [Virgibacillus sp. DJP39]|uniref:carbon storage regulator CsrA n=1 Tax=Virgibacillus sp. DJP39 TaxID=3409790 RepID=UPI003BB7C55F
MLVLTRKLNESIQIGDEIEVKVLGIEGDQIKLGIAAPKSVEVHRKEVYIDIQEQNSAAANLPTDVLGLIEKKE